MVHLEGGPRVVRPGVVPEVGRDGRHLIAFSPEEDGEEDGWVEPPEAEAGGADRL